MSLVSFGIGVLVNGRNELRFPNKHFFVVFRIFFAVPKIFIVMFMESQEANHTALLQGAVDHLWLVLVE